MLSSVPEIVQQGIRKIFTSTAGSLFNLKSFSFSSGGCINHGGKLETSAGNFFLKWNDALKFPGMFKAEAKGLEALRKPLAIQIPEVRGHGVEGYYQFLLLDFIESKRSCKSYWEDLGHGLAALHKNTSAAFGLDHSNYIGSLQQFNTHKTSWVNFFIEQRLQIQLQYAIDSGVMDNSLIKEFENLYKELPALLPEESPSLLHGDLWSGNIITDENGKPCLIDPAVYYGHREMDLAMTRLFGQFEKEFYESYTNAFPLIAGHKERVDIYNLYPLMVHVNLFGGSYRRQVELILQQYR